MTNTEIPKERREELRRREREANFDGGAMLPWYEIDALLNMADERDRLRGLLEEQKAAMRRALIFISSKQKMHEHGVEMHEDLLHRVEDELNGSQS